MIRKVFAYIVRNRYVGAQLLAFQCMDEPGFEVPKGTVEQGETLEEAVLREVLEESGLDSLQIVKKLGMTTWVGRGGPTMEGPIEEQEHHCYLLEPTGSLPETWEHIVTGTGIDVGVCFRYRWLDIGDDLSFHLVQGSEAFTTQLCDTYR